MPLRATYKAAVVSDTHLRAGHGDDFKFDRQFSDLVDHLIREGYNELVLNGDIFEFVATWPDTDDHPNPGLGYTESEATARLVAIAMEHEGFFEALRRFIAEGGRVVVLPGNHDWELHFPEVRRQFAATLRNPGHERLQFVLHGRPYEPIEGLHIEHGHQLVDDQNIFHYPTAPLRPDPLGGPARIEQSVGNWLVRCLVNPIERHFPFVNNVKPFMKIDWLGGRGVHAMRLMSALVEGSRGVFQDKRIPRRIKTVVLSTEPFLGFLGPVRTPLNWLRPEHVMPDLIHAINDDSTESLRKVARRHLQVFGKTRYVVMGHSHEHIDRHHEVNRYFARHGRAYLNPGSWNPCIHVPEGQGPIPLDNLYSDALYPYRLSYVHVQGDTRADLEARTETFESGEVKLVA